MPPCVCVIGWEGAADYALEPVVGILSRVRTVSAGRGESVMYADRLVGTLCLNSATACNDRRREPFRPAHPIQNLVITGNSEGPSTEGGLAKICSSEGAAEHARGRRIGPATAHSPSVFERKSRSQKAIALSPSGHRLLGLRGRSDFVAGRIMPI